LPAHLSACLPACLPAHLLACLPACSLPCPTGNALPLLVISAAFLLYLHASQHYCTRPAWVASMVPPPHAGRHFLGELLAPAAAALPLQYTLIPLFLNAQDNQVSACRNLPASRPQAHRQLAGTGSWQEPAHGWPSSWALYLALPQDGILLCFPFWRANRYQPARDG